jgi:hypothetical protein
VESIVAPESIGWRANVAGAVPDVQKKARSAAESAHFYCAVI